MDDSAAPPAKTDGPAAGPRSAANRTAAEQIYTGIIEFLPDATFAVDTDRRVVIWNHACEVLTGASRHAMLGENTSACAEAFFGKRQPTLIDLLDSPASDAPALYEHVERSGDVIAAETFSGCVKGGRGAHLRAAAFPLFDGEGRRCGAVEVVRDISDQKRIEGALEDSRERLLKAQRLARVGFLDWDLKTDEVFLSEEACELTGFRPADQITTPELVARLVHPDDVAKVRANLALAIRDLKPYDLVHRHVRPDGTIVWVHAQAQLQRDATGAPSRLLGTMVDITDIKVMEDALRNRETQLSLILNNVSDVIFAVAVEAAGGFRFISVNRRFLEATGVPESQVVGAPVRDVIPEAAHQLVFGKYREAIATGRPVHWEEVSEYPSGVKVGHVTVVPVYDADGVCVQLVGMVHDVSERKRAEEQVRQLNEDLKRHAEVLEQRVESRTAQLAARNQELKGFAYTVSHDLKAPLRGIAGYANELSRKHSGGLDERARFCLSQILAAATNLDRLIEDLLHYSRLDAETPSLTDVNPREIVDAVLRDRHLTITEQRVEVTVDVPATTVRTWERGLVQVLTNLIDNALKYSRHASQPRVCISADRLGEEWRLRVSDNGIGFDMKYADRIFGLFNRLVLIDEYEGTGAGLAIVKKVLDKQGGRIWAESAPGEGATFFVALPLARGQA